MRRTFAIILTLIGLLAFGQENKLDRIDNEVNSIELNSNLALIEFDWVELTGITTDGGGILKVWRNDRQICKIVEEIGLSYGRIKTTIYLENGMPIKIVETEENFKKTNDGLNYSNLEEVFIATIYVFDWENDESKIIRKGKRFYTEGDCSNFDYEPVIQRAKKATTQIQKMEIDTSLLLGIWDSTEGGDADFRITENEFFLIDFFESSEYKIDNNLIVIKESDFYENGLILKVSSDSLKIKWIEQDIVVDYWRFKD